MGCFHHRLTDSSSGIVSDNLGAMSGLIWDECKAGYGGRDGVERVGGRSGMDGMHGADTVDGVE